jgi:hypothetical protein
MDLQGVTDELYGAPPEQFTARRDELARQAAAEGDKALATSVRALRRPTAAAWVVNSLVRQEPEAVEALIALGERMREAQSTLSGDRMRALSRERQAVLRDLVGLATSRAGGSVSAAVSQEVEQTLRAVVADEDASAAVRSGCLTHGLSWSGLGPAGGAAPRRHLQAVPPQATTDDTRETSANGASRAAEREAAERRRELERDLAEAQSALRSSERAATAATTRAERSRRRQQEAEEEVAELERACEAARERAAAARSAAGTAADQAAAARSVAAAARQEVERIRPALDGF